ncbi:MAG: DegV family protein [Actinomycetia bacterium]|nr:DegV family protein [Actinomycetes bacterium]
MSGVAIVTDSTSYLPKEMVEKYAITVVPVNVIIDGQVYEEGRDISPAEVAEALRESRMVSTSKPTPARFTQAYESLAEAGAKAIVSIHVSSDLSSTYDSALLGSRDAPIPVTVVDSRTVSMGLGYAAADAAVAAAAGATAAQAGEVGLQTALATSVLFYVDKLEYLRRGGRIGAAQRVIGSALAVKPILHVANGQVEPLEKVRTRGKAISRLVDLAVEKATPGPARIAIQHLGAQNYAERMQAEINDQLPNDELVFGEIGAVVGAHVGPGMLSAIVSPGEPV